MTSSGYIPGTVDTQSRCWRDRRELHRELPHRCSLSIGERERGEKKKTIRGGRRDRLEGDVGGGAG